MYHYEVLLMTEIKPLKKVENNENNSRSLGISKRAGFIAVMAR